MNENRRKILELLAEGRITADEAERLISALGSPAPETNETAPRSKAKYLRVLVEADDDAQGKGPSKVNIRVPMQLLRAGVRLAGLIPVQARDQVNDALRKQGVAFDINQIKPENLEELVDQLNDLTVDVDQKQNNVKVRVFSE